MGCNCMKNILFVSYKPLACKSWRLLLCTSSVWLQSYYHSIRTICQLCRAPTLLSFSVSATKCIFWTTLIVSEFKMCSVQCQLARVISRLQIITQSRVFAAARCPWRNSRRNSNRCKEDHTSFFKRNLSNNSIRKINQISSFLLFSSSITASFSQKTEIKIFYFFQHRKLLFS